RMMAGLAPQGRARPEELGGVDLVGPAEEGALGLLVGRAVDGGAPGIDSGVRVVAALESGLTLLDRRPFGVPLAHGASMAGRLVRRRSQLFAISSTGSGRP